MAIDDVKDPEANFYCDDYALTALLLKEQAEYIAGTRTQASNEIGTYFLQIREHVLKKRNFSGYSANWKDEFRSKSNELFAKHWHKFDPSRARKNYTQVDGELFYKEDPAEWRGGFGWFSLFCKTAAVDEIKRLKRISQNVQKVIDGKNHDLNSIDTFLYM